MEKNLLIIWDKKDNYQTKEKRDINLQKLYVEEIKHPFFKNINSCDVLDSEEELISDSYQLIDMDYGKYSGVILLLKLEWELLVGKYNGLEVLRMLREKGCNLPVFLMATESKKEIYQTESNLRGLLKTPGNYLVDKNKGSIDLKENEVPQVLSDILLEDILYYTNSKKGCLDEIIHTLRNKLSQEAMIYSSSEIEQMIVTIKEIIPVIEELLEDDLQEVHFDIWESTISILRNAARNKTKLTPSDEVDKAKASILNLLPEVNRLFKPEKREVSWKVLYLDDDKKFLNDLQARFNLRGVDCLTAETGAEALDILQKDINGTLDWKGQLLPPNSITALICDWRLQNELEEWDPIQGYEVIDKVAHDMSNMNSFFVLTSKKGGIIRNVQKSVPYRINWFAKGDVLQSDVSFEFFLDKLLEKGEGTYQSLIFRPNLPSWRTKSCHRASLPLGEYYRQFRMSIDYQKREREISELATDFIEQAITIKHYYSDVANPKMLEIESEIAPSAEMNSSRLEDVWIQFRDRLVARRVALVLYKLEEWDVEDISSVLMSRKLGGNLTRWFFSEVMCLSAAMDNNFGDQTLIEEINWFEKEFGYKVNFLNDKTRRAIKILFTAFGRQVKDILKDYKTKRFEIYNEFAFLFDYREPSSFKEIGRMFKDIDKLIEFDVIFQNGLKAKWELGFVKFASNKGNSKFLKKIIKSN